MIIEVSSAHVERLLAEARNALPREACGLLLGNGAQIEEVRVCRNVHPQPETHFEIDPQALIDALKARFGERCSTALVSLAVTCASDACSCFVQLAASDWAVGLGVGATDGF